MSFRYIEQGETFLHIEFFLLHQLQVVFTNSLAPSKIILAQIVILTIQIFDIKEKFGYS